MLEIFAHKNHTNLSISRLQPMADDNPQKIVFFKPITGVRKKGNEPSSSSNENNCSQVKRKPKTGTQDIFEIHTKILATFDREYSELDTLRKKLKRLEWITQNGSDASERQLAATEFTKLHNHVYLIESGKREAQYLYRSEAILKEYTELLNQTVKVDFMGNKIYDNNDRKQALLIDFINIAKNYIDVKPVENPRKGLVCDKCCIDLQRAEDLLYVCPGCGYFVKQYASVASYQDNNRINVAQRYVYDKRAHFGDSIKKYQAKQNTTIPAVVYQDLWDKIHSHDLSVDKITKDHIYEFLKSTKHTDHYEDITLIYCEITKNKPPDISHLEQKLFKLFDEIDPVYERIKPADRINFLNGQFVLFKLLQKLRYPCDEEDFYILKTRDKMLEHDQMWKKICHEKQWTYIATV